MIQVCHITTRVYHNEENGFNDVVNYHLTKLQEAGSVIQDIKYSTSTESTHHTIHGALIIYKTNNSESTLVNTPIPACA